MHTKDKLAQAMREAKLPQGIIANATAGYYDDFLSPLATPLLELAKDLLTIATPAALELRLRVIRGDFDGTPEESEAWAESPEGQAAMARLLKRS